MKILKLTLVNFLLVVLCNCQSSTSIEQKNSESNAANDTLTQVVKHKNELLLIDTTHHHTKYQITFDTIKKHLLFYENNKVIQLDTSNNLDGISQETLENFKLNEYNFEVDLLNNNEFSDNQQVVLTKDYTYIEMTDNLIHTELYFLFKDSTEQKYKLINVLQADTLKYYSKCSYVDASYIDTLRNYLVTEDRLSFNSGPYLIRVFKIEQDTIRKIGESINNHENYKRLKKKYEHNFLWVRMMQEHAEKIIRKANR